MTSCIRGRALPNDHFKWGGGGILCNGGSFKKRINRMKGSLLTGCLSVESVLKKCVSGCS